MKITIHGSKRPICIALPNFVVFSRAGLRFLQKQSDKMLFEDVDPRRMRVIRKTVKEMKKLHKNWCLLEVEENDSPIVRIEL